MVCVLLIAILIPFRICLVVVAGRLKERGA